MGTGWRRAFCTTIHRDQDSVIKEKQQTSPSSSPSPRSCTRLGFFSGGSNPITPRLHSQPVSSPSLRCRTPAASLSTNESPRLQSKITANETKSLGSNPSSPRSPLKLSFFKNSFKFRSSCGICLNRLKTGQGMAIYTAECAHAFHFPCIADYVRKNGKLVCPVCNATWKDVPLLAIHKNLQGDAQQEQNDAVNPLPAKPNTNSMNIQPQIEEKRVIESSPRAVKTSKRESRQLSPKLSDSRSYDDDEPLLSPTAGGKFNPIPEADENAEDDETEDVEEFQGFFVNTNPIPTPNPPEISFKSDELPNSGKDSGNVQVIVLPESAVVSAGRGYETYAVALRVKAPRPLSLSHSSNTALFLDPSLRAAIDLVTVLDVSDSMTGAKLQMLKRAMRLVIASLGSTDRLSIVAFSASPKRLLPLRRMTAPVQRDARRIVDRLICGQGTSFGEALKKATKILEDRRERNPVASVLLFSDGQDERVQTNTSHQRQIYSHVFSTRFAHIEIPVRESGFGRSGGYGRETAEGTLAKCVGNLLNVVVQDLRIQLNFASGSAPAEISAVYSLNGRPTVLSSASVRLGDLYAEEERDLLVEMRVPCSAVGAHHVMSVRCLYKSAATQEVVCGRDQALLVPRPHAGRSSGPKIERLRNLFISTRAVAEGRKLAEYGDITSAYHLLASSRALLLQSSSIPVDEYARNIESELAELNRHRQQQMEDQRQQMMQRRRVMDKDMTVVMEENGEPLTPGSAWRAAERLAKVAMMKKSLNKVSDLHGFENARF
ncbi:hypothetical protein HS088_TW11G00182 [Tripterygium wilfordii]|uniref:Zinc finger family protein n=1 Tax=Tripterygium wilfordii TaxID=458696 RepID=A0A7J7D188_TRIWF|nr:E3 ubiquitin-protein ligase WAV3-like [Tripterygium wilfordii]KAF5740117.1 hypothetical protein HS088_TW11G00182 [Tripterygium wilfordii]